MAPHICSRDICPPKNISSGSIRCFLCKALSFKLCFGVDDSVYDAMAPMAPFVRGANIQFICPGCLISSDDGKNINCNKPSGSGEALTTSNSDDIEAIKSKLCKIMINQAIVDTKLNKLQETSELSCGKLSEIHAVSVDMNKVCIDIDTNFKKSDGKRSKPSFSDILRGNNGSPPIRPQLTKRARVEREDIPGIAQQQRPNHFVGTLDVVIGPAVPLIVERSSPSRRKFDRSLWISRLHPETTTDQILEYVMSKTDCNDKSSFFCKKLVKRDADLSLLQFVSFKVDVNNEHFQCLIDPNVWPKTVRVREFIVEGAPAAKLLSSEDAVNSKVANTSVMDIVDDELINFNRSNKEVTLNLEHSSPKN